MSSICSKIESIDNLWFEPIPSKARAMQRMCRIENIVVALGADGKIYTNAVIARVAYTGGHGGRLSHLLDGCIKLGVLAASEVKKHKDYMAERQRIRDHKFNVEQLQTYTNRLGIQLTPEQLEALK